MRPRDATFAHKGVCNRNIRHFGEIYISLFVEVDEKFVFSR